jgi:hypothetical protein
MLTSLYKAPSRGGFGFRVRSLRMIVFVARRSSPPAQRLSRARLAETFNMASAAPQALGERDWSNLTAGPAGAIAERVLSNDYVDLLRFRAVCRAWRAGSAHLRARGALDRRFHPRRWVLLPCAFASLPRRLFLNVVTGEPVVLVLPDLRSCYLQGHTAEGPPRPVPDGHPRRATPQPAYGAARRPPARGLAAGLERRPAAAPAKEPRAARRGPRRRLHGRAQLPELLPVP